MILLNLSWFEYNLCQTIESSNFNFSFGIVCKYNNLLYQFLCGIINARYLILLIDTVNNIQSLIFQKRVCIFSNVLQQLSYPHSFVCFILNKIKITMSYRITLDTICLIDIFWSPNFYIMTEIRFCRCISDDLSYWTMFSSIRRVRPTIFGLGSFINFNMLGTAALIDC